MRSPGGKGDPARRCLHGLGFMRRLAPGGTRPLPGGLEAGSA